jgi:hypothetical protein
MRAATAAAEPLLEPPGVWPGFQGFLVGAGYGVATGSGEGKEVLSLLMLPMGFLIQSGIISNSLETDYGAACLVSLVMYVIWFVIIVVLVGILLCFAPLKASGFVG